jgi:hypothetical protein
MLYFILYLYATFIVFVGAVFFRRVFFVLNAIPMFVFSNGLVIVLVSFPIYVNVVHFFLLYCFGCSVLFYFYIYIYI